MQTGYDVLAGKSSYDQEFRWTSPTSVRVNCKNHISHDQNNLQQRQKWLILLEPLSLGDKSGQLQLKTAVNLYLSWGASIKTSKYRKPSIGGAACRQNKNSLSPTKCHPSSSFIPLRRDATTKFCAQQYQGDFHQTKKMRMDRFFLW